MFENFSHNIILKASELVGIFFGTKAVHHTGIAAQYLFDRDKLGSWEVDTIYLCICW